MSEERPAPTPDEQPKRKVAKKVIAQKRQYFVPSLGVTVDATSVDEAITLAESQVKKRSPEVGDA